MRKFTLAAFAVLCVAGAAAASAESGRFSEFGVRTGGSYPIGPINRYGPSHHLSAVAAWHNRAVVAGLDFSADTQHIARRPSGVGASGDENYDAKINGWHIGPWVGYKLARGTVQIMPLAGMGVYQINTFQRCENQLRPDCGDAHELHSVNTSNYLGFNAGLQVGLRIKKIVLGAEARLHQLTGGGRHRSPTFFAPTVFLVWRTGD